MPVKASAVGKLCFELGVTGNALVTGELLPCGVTLGAVAQALQLCVCFGKLSGRQEICRRRLGSENQRPCQTEPTGFERPTIHQAFAPKSHQKPR